MASLKAINFMKPGAYGLNTSDEVAADQALRFAATVNNGVVDSSGKLSSRKYWTLQTTGLSTGIQQVYVYRHTDAVETVVSASTNEIFTGLSSLTVRASGATDAHWCFANLSGKLYAAQAGHNGKVFDGSTFAAESFTSNAWSQPNIFLAAYGRLWAADDTSNKHTVWWSNLLDGKNWGTGDSGSLSLINAWPNGQDKIVALAALSGRLMIFGRKSILMYTLPADNSPASMTLTDAVSGIGAVGRDSVVTTDSGVYFVADNGIYKFDKLGQVTALLTAGQQSKLVTDDVLAAIAAETPAKIKAGYYPTEGWYVVSFPTSAVTYCVHTRQTIPEVSVPVITKWTHTETPQRGFAVNASDTWYTGGTNGIYAYTGYVAPSTAFSFDFYTQWNGFQAEDKLKHLKKVDLVLEAASGQTGTLKWQQDYKAGTTYSRSFTCDSTEFAENPGIGTVKQNIGGSCNTARFGFSITPAAQVTLHQMRVFFAGGATKP